MRKTGDVVASLILIAVGTAVLFASVPLQVGTPREPQPGFFPFVSGSILIVLALLLLINAYRGRTAGMQAFGQLWRPITLIVGLFFYSIVLDPLGYVIATIVLSAVILRVLDTKSWWKLAGVSFGLSMGTYLLFDRLLGVSLPHGILQAWV